MTYFAITRETASWVLNKPDLVSDLAAILTDQSQLGKLRTGDMIQGPARLSGSKDGLLLAFWNAEYLSGVGQESWGFCRLSSPLGLNDSPELARRILQTELEIIRLRLDGLKLDAKLIHRNWGDGISTTRADRGDAGGYWNLGYVEDYVELGPEEGAKTQSHSIIILGPEHEFPALVDAARNARHELPQLIEVANDLLLPSSRRPILEQQISRQQSLVVGGVSETSFEAATVVASQIPDQKKYQTMGWAFDEWVKNVDTLSREQRQLFQSDFPISHPVRIVGRAGSGKSLIMQLMTVKHLRRAREEESSLRILYIVHNSSMAQFVKERFELLTGPEFFDSTQQTLHIRTLSDYALSQLKIDDRSIIDRDADQTKAFQRSVIEECLREQIIDKNAARGGEIFGAVADDATSFALAVDLIVAEISGAIKGHGLVRDRQRYVYGEHSLSRLHSILKEDDRAFVFDVFRRYHGTIFEHEQYLDSDDIAISLVSDLETPVWDLRRKSEGYDMVFVDETQLFNENERRAFALLTRGNTQLQPIALALDEAQEFFGQTSAGFASLGIEELREERLSGNQRSTDEIIRLAFFIIQQSTDLFSGDFPVIAYSRIPSDFVKCAPPRLEFASAESRNIGKATVKRISELRTRNIQKVAIVCHADVYWDILATEIAAWATERSERVVHLLQRGEALAGGPNVVLTKPAYVGGQEFEAVICIGLEQGLVPPRSSNKALEIALYQQSLREMYLSVSRAQYRVMFLMAHGASPNEIVQLAIQEKYIQEPTNTSSGP